MGALKVIGIVAAAWLLLSVIVAAGWARLKRGPRPVPGDKHLHVVYDDDSYPVMSDDVFDVEREGL